MNTVSPGPTSLPQVEIEVRNIFVVGARGPVLIGYLRSGTLRVGQRTEPIVFGESPARALELVGVEHLSSMQSGASTVGLVFRTPPGLRDFERALIPGFRLKLFDT